MKKSINQVRRILTILITILILISPLFFYTGTFLWLPTVFINSNSTLSDIGLNQTSISDQIIILRAVGIPVSFLTIFVSSTMGFLIGIDSMIFNIPLTQYLLLFSCLLGICGCLTEKSVNTNEHFSEELQTGLILDNNNNLWKYTYTVRRYNPVIFLILCFLCLTFSLYFLYIVIFWVLPLFIAILLGKFLIFIYQNLILKK
jgi:phosphate/sulfate permease